MVDNRAPTYPHGAPETETERQDLLKRLLSERYPPGTTGRPTTQKQAPHGYETGPIPPSGGYTRPTEPPNGADGDPNTTHRPIT